MIYPSPMDIAEAEDREAGMLDGQDLQLLRLNGLGKYADETLSLREQVAALREQLRLCNIDQCNAETQLAICISAQKS